MPHTTAQKNAYRRRRAQTDPEYREKRLARRRQQRKNPNGKLASWVKQANKRGRLRGVPADLRVGDLGEIPCACPVLGIPLGTGEYGSHPSIDRLIPHLGYVAGNIRVISLRANMLRSNATVEELRLVLADAEKLAFSTPAPLDSPPSGKPSSLHPV